MMENPNQGNGTGQRPQFVDGSLSDLGPAPTAPLWPGPGNDPSNAQTQPSMRTPNRPTAPDPAAARQQGRAEGVQIQQAREAARQHWRILTGAGIALLLATLCVASGRAVPTWNAITGNFSGGPGTSHNEGGTGKPTATPTTGEAGAGPGAGTTPESACGVPIPTENVPPDSNGNGPGFIVDTHGEGPAMVSLWYPTSLSSGYGYFGNAEITTIQPAGTTVAYPGASGKPWEFSASCSTDDIVNEQNGYDTRRSKVTNWYGPVDFATLQADGLAVDPPTANRSGTTTPVLDRIRQESHFGKPQQQSLPMAIGRKIGFLPM